MNEIEFIVSIVIPNEKEHFKKDLIALATKHGIKPTSEEIITNGVRYVFKFENQKSKKVFYNSIPVEWI
ncbi:MAG: hypothetical protein LCH35_02605 [Bacteroidetes bacterium]|uniref:hypothetical protein n=1 Tax=Flavobacterium sp. TaxID=239 RepID=UPI002FD8E9DE|nr:hypothetical protein [Bacteroidota bacterium]